MKKIKRIATGGIVGSLLFVSSGSVSAQTTPLNTSSIQRDISFNRDLETSSDSGLQQTAQINDIFIKADDNLQNDSKDALFEQGFNPSQIQKLYNSRHGKFDRRNFDEE